MAAAPKRTTRSEAAPAPVVVLTPFAYATKTDGEVVQLRRGDVIEQGKYKKESVDHLTSIGFIGQQD